MLTRNFYQGIAAFISATDQTGVKVDGSSAKITKSLLSGNTSAIKGIAAVMPYLQSISAYGGYGVIFGSGTTPPTLDDYNIEKQITGFTATNPSATSINKTENGIELTVTYGITAKSTMSISEIATFVYSNESGSGSFLIDRTVLETPIVIDAGTSKQVTYTIRFNYPTA